MANGVSKILNLKCLGNTVNFREISYLIRGAIILEKVVTEKLKWKKKRMVKITMH